MGIFRNGLPTDIDINKIRAQYPDNNLKQGMKIAYEEISHLLGIDLASYRFRTVIARWRKKLENENGGVWQGVGYGKASRGREAQGKAWNSVGSGAVR